MEMNLYPLKNKIGFFSISPYLDYQKHFLEWAAGSVCVVSPGHPKPLNLGRAHLREKWGSLHMQDVTSL